VDLKELYGKLDELTASAIAAFWSGRDQQLKKQLDSGKKDQGTRGAATGGKHFDGLLLLLTESLKAAGVPESSIYAQSKLEIPGFYRPTKKWDLLVVHKGRLLVALETKAIVGSFGNNCNNRAEEAIGNAADLWRAHKDEAYVSAVRPWLGFVFIVEDAQKSSGAVAVKEPHYKVLKEFKGASYKDRCRLLCRKLMLDGQYTATAFITTKKDHSYNQPDPDLRLETFIRSMCGHVQAHLVSHEQD